MAVEATPIQEAPERIGPYRVLGLLGEGGMGVVYRAAHVDTGELVALKTVHTSNERMLASIRREIHALGRLRHAGVVRIAGEGIDHALPWYAMELLEGLTLQRMADSRWGVVLASAPTLPGDALPPMGGVAVSGEFHVEENVSLRSRIPPEQLKGQPAAAGVLAEALSIVRRLCVPLAFLHGEGIVHRDLKPENVFIRAGDLPVLVDFGLVSSFEGAQGRDALEPAGTTMGTPAYMAPEQIRGEVVDARADLYSLGCVLYELVTGRPPFVADTTIELVGKHLLLAPVRPSELVTGVAPALDELILRLLAKNPRDRIGHADDLASALVALGASPAAGYEGALPAPRAYLYRPGFTGRDEVFRKLRQLIDRARGGGGSLAFLAGESGVGKTRLATETGRAATGAGLRVVACECVPFNVAETEGVDYNGAPFHPFARFLEAVADKCLEFGPDETARLLGARGWVLAQYEPSLARVPGLDEFPRPAALPAEAARERLFHDLADTLAAYADERPLFMLVDDLQWADELTLAFLASLPASFFEEHPVVIVGTWRSEEANDTLRGLAALPHATALELGHLDEAAVGEIVSAMLSLRKAPEGYAKFLAQRSEGNPFFVAEYLRTAVAEGLLFRDAEGRWTVTSADADARDTLERLPLPMSVRDLVTRRLDSLTGFAGTVAAIASVLGRDIDGDVMLLVARGDGALDDAAWWESVRDLLDRQVLEERQAGQFRFVHDRLREIAYARIPDERRRELHRRCAEAIEASCTDADEKAIHYRALAHHWTQAAVLPRAIEYLDKAGTQALDAFSNREAVAFFGEVLLLASREGSPVEPVTAARWERSLAEAYLRIGSLQEGRAHAEMALVHCGRPMPTSTARWALGLAGQVAVRFARSLVPWRRTHRALPGDALGLEAANTLYRMLEVFLYGNDPLRGIYCGMRNLNVAETLPASPSLARGYAMMSIVVTTTPLRRIGRAWAERSLAIAETLGSPGTLAYCLSRAGVSRIHSAGWTEAEEGLRRGIELCLSTGDGRQLEECRSILALGLCYRGVFAESLALWAEVHRSAVQRSDEQIACWARIGQAQSLLRLGRTDEALATLDAGASWVDAKAPAAEAIWARGFLALTRLHAGDFDGARDAAEKTLGLMKKSQPVVYYMEAGVVGVAEVFNALAGRASGAERTAMLTRAAEAGRVLNIFALMFKFARPANLLNAGARLLVEGRASKAVATWRRGLKAAQELAMPFEEAQLRRQLAAHDPSADRGAELRAAAAIFESLGAVAERASVDALLGGEAPAA